MRIVSLVPHATELLFALGLGSELVAVSHECDYPPAARELPSLTRDVLPPGLSSRDVDAAVRDRVSAGEAIYELDEVQLEDLEPDLIVTQALCPVCAVSYETVAQIAATLPTQPEVISLDPHTFGETLGDIRTIAAATETRDRGVDLLRSIADRVDRVKLAVRGLDRPRVAALEWLDPPFAAGHWVPQLVELAGGEDALSLAGEPSEETSWELIRAARPDLVVAMPCGYGAERSAVEARGVAAELAAVGARTVAVDSAAYYSRPGPRLVDGLELLAHLLHPDAVAAPPGIEAIAVAL